MKSLFKDVWSLSAPYFRSADRKVAWLLLAVIVGMSLFDVYLSVLFNEWNNDFYNSLQNTNKEAFYDALFKFSWLAALFIINAVYRLYLNQMLQIRWRRWMTGQYLDKWLSRQSYYRLQVAGNPADNPDQRITEDINQFISLTLDLTLGLLSSVVTLFSFLFILWTLSGDFSFSKGGYAFTIPGYMVWFALGYAVAGTWITSKLGRPLISLNFDQQKYEADFRFSLIRLRENAESVAFYHGELQEKQGFVTRFSRVFDNYWQIMKRQKTLTWFTSGYYQIAIIFPYVVAAPRYFAEQIKLGGLMQTASAFGQVQGALSYIIGAYTSIATWKSVIARLTGFTESMEAVTAQVQGAPVLAAGQGVTAANLNVGLPDGRQLLKGVDFNVAAGEALLIQGPSGSGKSTLLRVMSGLWPWASGGISIPQDAKVLFTPQKPYLPLGTLRDALLYPNIAGVSDDALKAALETCRLPHLASRLDDSEAWSHILSLGEQQRVAFLRMLLAKPSVIFLDEASSALDEDAEAYFYRLLRERLPQSSIISVGHRGTLKPLHDRVLNLGAFRAA
jgi:putative ATP-binding cassette transporter